LDTIDWDLAAHQENKESNGCPKQFLSERDLQSKLKYEDANKKKEREKGRILNGYRSVQQQGKGSF
tara:strand:- start:75 stop:272 length:198 start_codon:yes stop_codon:yes gene_type:complete